MATPVQRLEVLQRLKGKVLRLDANSFDRDYSGGTSFSERSSAIFLFDDRTFRFESSSFTSLSSGGMTLSSGSPNKRVVEGAWSITSDGFNPVLELKYEDGSIFQTYILRVPFVQGIEHLDGRPWKRFLIA